MYLIVCELEASTIRRLRPEVGFSAQNKKIVSFSFELH